MKIGIIGMGVVGEAIAAAHNRDDLACYDKFREERCLNVGLLDKTDLCFVCVPTPTEEGKQDLSAVRDVMHKLSSMGYRGVVVLKSTVLPGTTRSLAKTYPLLRIVHSPEFLSERSAKKDYVEQDSILVSGKELDTKVVEEYADNCFLRYVRVFISSSYEATELAKYIHNCALAIQLSFLNEIYDLDPMNYAAAADMAEELGNINRHHIIPGPDGKRGWGGMCFPKDTEALLTHAKNLGLRMPTLQGAIDFNRLIRPAF